MQYDIVTVREVLAKENYAPFGNHKFDYRKSTLC